MTPMEFMENKTTKNNERKKQFLIIDFSYRMPSREKNNVISQIFVSILLVHNGMKEPLEIIQKNW